MGNKEALQTLFDEAIGGLNTASQKLQLITEKADNEVALDHKTRVRSLQEEVLDVARRVAAQRARTLGGEPLPNHNGGK